MSPNFHFGYLSKIMFTFSYKKRNHLSFHLHIYTNDTYHNVNIMKIHKNRVKRNQESRQFFTLCNLQLVNSTQPNFCKIKFLFLKYKYLPHANRYEKFIQIMTCINLNFLLCSSRILEFI